MRLKIECQDRMGIAMDILAVVVKHRVNIADIELAGKRFYILLPGAASHTISALTNDVLTIPGVVKVERVDFMPKEREHFEFNVLLNSVAFPVLSVDMKGIILYANPAAQEVFATDDVLRDRPLKSLLRDFNVKDTLKNLTENRYGVPISYEGHDYALDIFPVEIEEWNEKTRIGAVLSFQSAIHTTSLMKEDPSISALHDGWFVYQSNEMKHLLMQLESFARLEGSLLLIGETGVGKAQAAQHCHQLFAGSELGFNAVNCSGLNESELDVLLREKLIDTSQGESPNSALRKTLYLENIDQLSRSAQLHLIKLLHQSTTHATLASDADELPQAISAHRIIASSQQTPIAFAQSASNCYELFTLLGKYTLSLPPLRERGSLEILYLAEHYLNEFSTVSGTPRKTLTPDAKDAIKAHAWPGNLEELWQRLEQASMQSRTNELSRSALFPGQNLEQTMGFGDFLIDDSQGLDDMLKGFERRILQHLHPAYPSSRKLAKRLGLSHTAIANKLREHGIP